MKSTDDLKAAFAGESQANRKYTAWAQKAEREGFPGVAKLFRAVAAAETVHALNHFRALGEVKSTLENLEAAKAGENYEVTSMYPEMIEHAESDEAKRALLSFTWAFEVEKIHEKLYAAAIEKAKSGEDSAVTTYWVCGSCGHTIAADEPPEKCPVCGAVARAYKKIE